MLKANSWENILDIFTLKNVAKFYYLSSYMSQFIQVADCMQKLSLLLVIAILRNR